MSVLPQPSNRSLLDFIHRWQGSKLTERSAAQSHFIDLCEALGERRPTDVDQEGATYTFEKGVAKTGGGSGFADVWKRGYFAWEYKKQHANLAAAYRQLLNYQEDLENPPLLVVCDTDRFEVHTRFTNTVTKVYEFRLADLADPLAVSGAHLSALNILRAVFGNPDALRPRQTTAQVTEDAAREFAQLASSLHGAGVAPEPAAHFLMRLLFCLFAQDIQLLPPGREPTDDPRVRAIAQAAQDLVRERDAWPNPPGAAENELKRRTLTNLYNQRPTWLDLAHRKLDHAVLDAYGWPHDLTDKAVVERLLALNLERANGQEGARQAVVPVTPD